MSAEEFGPTVFLVGYGLMLLAAVRVFGVRRVLWALGLIVVLGFAIVFKTLGVITGGRRS